MSRPNSKSKVSDLVREFESLLRGGWKLSKVQKARTQGKLTFTVIYEKEEGFGRINLDDIPYAPPLDSRYQPEDTELRA